MNELLIDVTRLVGRFMKGRLPTGIDRVSLAYVRYYGEEARAVVRFAGRCWVLSKADSERLFQWLLAPNGWREPAILIAKGVLFGWCRQQVAGSILINTGHSGLEQGAYAEWLKRRGIRPLFMVHDLIPITHPEYCRDGERGRHIARMKNVLAHASGIIANSQATLNELAAFAKGMGQSVPSAAAALLAPGMSNAIPGTRPMAAPYFVVLSTIEPRKNHWMLLQIWKGLVECLGADAPRLVVIGQRGWECENVLDLLERCEQLKGYVFERPNCSDAELTTYLHHAQALLFPSFAEGYGMPLVEALAHGVPAIVSDLPVFKEVAGNIPEYVHPLDGSRWRDLVREYARPRSQLRFAQLRRMESFKVPSWADHFARVDTLLQRLGEVHS